MMKNFREMIIWNQRIDLAVHAYELTKQLPPQEMYGLSERLKFIRSVDVENFFVALHTEQKQINSLISRLKGK